VPATVDKIIVNDNAAEVKVAVREYLTPEGKSPFRDWLEVLDTAARARIQARVLRFESGNMGDHKSIGAGVWEARVAFGPGYRIYFGKVGATEIVLLCGGDKRTQRQDITRARRYWADYLEATRYG
jgi:putative addiction module killer protein